MSHIEVKRWVREKPRYYKNQKKKRNNKTTKQTGGGSDGEQINKCIATCTK